MLIVFITDIIPQGCFHFDVDSCDLFLWDYKSACSVNSNTPNNSDISLDLVLEKIQNFIHVVFGWFKETQANANAGNVIFYRQLIH